MRSQDLAGPHAVLAHHDLWTGVQVGRYYVDVPAFESIGLPALAQARQPGGVIVIDEIARMELSSAAFVDAVEQLLNEPVDLVATVHVHEHHLTDKLKARADFERIEVTEQNRDGMPAYLFDRFTTR